MPPLDEAQRKATKAAIKAAIEQETLRGEGDDVRVPKPRLVLRIGVTGHRPGRLARGAAALGLEPAELEANLAAALESVFRAIGRDALFLRDEMGELYAAETPLLRLVGGIAMGVDQLAQSVVADELKRAAPGDGETAAWEIDAIVPCSRAGFARQAADDFAIGLPRGEKADPEAYLRHWKKVFGWADTTLELPPSWRLGEAPAPGWSPPELPPEFGVVPEPPLPGYQLDYAPSADFLIRQVDLLVAVWDRAPAAGPGGTPDIVAKARTEGIPVVLLDPGDPRLVPHFVRRVRMADGSPGVTGWYERPLEPVLEQADARGGAIRDEMRKLVGLPPEAGHAAHGAQGGHGDHRSSGQRLLGFLKERWPTREEPQVFGLFHALCRWDWADIWKSRGRCVAPRTIKGHWSDPEWTRFIGGNPDEGHLGARLKQVLHRRYVVADLLAVQYADRYRRAFVGSYLLAALAVTLAVAGLFPVATKHALALKLVLVALEVAVILRILGLVSDGYRQHLHSKFVEYRSLAEALRQLRSLASFAEYAEARRRGAAAPVWWLWYLRATARELGLPEGRLDATYQSSLLSGVIKYEVMPQIEYHRGTAAREELAEENIHAVGRWSLYLTLAVLGLFIALVLGAWAVGIIVDPHLSGFEGAGFDAFVKHVSLSLYSFLAFAKPWVGVVAALLPALGAALTGIRFTADFQGKAARSAAMVGTLEALVSRLNEARSTQDFEATRGMLLEVTSAMADDVQAFQDLYGRKQLTLPG